VGDFGNQEELELPPDIGPSAKKELSEGGAEGGVQGRRRDWAREDQSRRHKMTKKKKRNYWVRKDGVKRKNWATLGHYWSDRCASG